MRQVEAGIEGCIEHRLFRRDTETPLGVGQTDTHAVR
jgi:hypothetical protein